MSWTERRLALACGLVPTLLAAVLALSARPPSPTSSTDVYDTLVRSLTPAPPTERVVVVDVDEKSLSAIGQWPWRRDVVARSWTRCADWAPPSIGVDVIFAEPDRDTTGAFAPDAVLADSLQQGGVVLGYAMRFDDGPLRQVPASGTRWDWPW